MNGSIALSADFLSAFARLPGRQQRGVQALITRFNANPQSPGLNYERIRGAREARMRSLRIDRGYRAIVLQPKKGNVHFLLWADKHDEAYAWATRHECRINEETGALQVYEPEPPPVSKPGPLVPPSGVFDPLRDRQLLRLGVPATMLPEVRGVASETGLDAMQSRLPVEAYEALFLYLAGDSYEKLVRERPGPGAAVDPGDFHAALDNVDSKVRFTIAHDQMELEATLHAPLARWRVFLHPSQRRLVERDWIGPVRVLGGAGTGKTVVAMHRARWLARKALEARAEGRPDGRILFTTFTKNLALDIEHNLRSICTPEEMKRIEVTNLDRWVHGFLRTRRYEFRIQFGREKKAWDRAMDQRDSTLDYPKGFYEEEWERVVLARGVETRAHYLRVARLGRGTPLNRALRAKVWPVFEEYRVQLAERGLKEAEDAYRDAAALLEAEASARGYTAVIVDEAQDLGEQAFRLLRRMVPEGANDLFVTGDAHQRIYLRGPVVLARCGIRVVGRARKLRLNYRTTEETRRWAARLLHGRRIDDLDGGTDDDRVRSLTRGPRPKVERCASFEEQTEALLRCFRTLSEEELRNVCVVVRTKKHLSEVQQAVHEAGVAVYRLGARSEDRTRKGVRFATMHRVKGLEFDRVVVASVTRSLVPLAMRLGRAGDELERKATETAERALLHVAATRARKELRIFTYGRPSPFLM